MKKSVVIYLSALFLSNLTGCDEPLPPKPDGWHCTYYYLEARPDLSGFYCNRISNPEQRAFFQTNDSFMQKSQCMDVDTFQKYTNYIEELKKLATKKCTKAIEEISNN